MWIVGLLVGAAIGATDGFDGFLIGGLIGAVAGVLLSLVFKRNENATRETARLADIETKLQHIYASLEDIHYRLLRLEKGTASPAVPASVADSEVEANTMPVAGSAMQPQPQPQPEVSIPPADIVAGTASSQATAGEQVEAPHPQTKPYPPKPNPIVAWLAGGNTLVRVGIVLLFFGVAFLLKYAAEHDLVPIELRLLAVAASAIVMLLTGWRLRGKRPGFGLVLQGGAIGVLYLTVFAAMRLYQLIPAGFAFVLLAGIAAAGAVLAVVQNSRSLAISGAVGGFLAPLLASTGSGNHIALFAYYGVLDLAILAIALFKAWRELNLIGFGFTFVIGAMWGAKYYRPEHFASTEPFLIFFFALYVAIAVLYALRQAPRLSHYVDATLVFGTPLIAFALQAALVREIEFGAAWSAIAVAVSYLLLAAVLYALKRATLPLLAESFLALGVIFATLAVPLAFDGRVTSAVWAVEGAGVLWVGIRQNRWRARACGALLQLLAGVAFVWGGARVAGMLPVFNAFYAGCFMISVAALFCARCLDGHEDRIKGAERLVSRLLFAWGTLWWFVSGFVEIEHYTRDLGMHPDLLFVAVSCGGYALLWRHLNWRIARVVALAVVPLAALMAMESLSMSSAQSHPFAFHAYVGWMLVATVHLITLHWHEPHRQRILEWLHTAGLWLMVLVLSWEVGWQIDHYVQAGRTWSLIAWALVPGLTITLFALRGERAGWPVSEHRHAYLYRGALPIAVALLGWTLFANAFSNGDPAPLPYIPVLNPLELALTGALLAVAIWWFMMHRLKLPGVELPGPDGAVKLYAVLIFLLLNGVLLRSLHHYAGVPFRLDAMIRSVLAQASLSIFWSLIALVVMVLATRRGVRKIWLMGAALLAVVVAKLFLLDLSNSGTVERWVSFIGVGALVIVIGYFSPVPPDSIKRGEHA